MKKIKIKDGEVDIGDIVYFFPNININNVKFYDDIDLISEAEILSLPKHKGFIDLKMKDGICHYAMMNSVLFKSKDSKEFVEKFEEVKKNVISMFNSKSQQLEDEKNRIKDRIKVFEEMKL